LASTPPSFIFGIVLGYWKILEEKMEEEEYDHECW